MGTWTRLKFPRFWFQKIHHYTISRCMFFRSSSRIIFCIQFNIIQTTTVAVSLCITILFMLSLYLCSVLVRRSTRPEKRSEHLPLRCALIGRLVWMERLGKCVVHMFWWCWRRIVFVHGISPRTRMVYKADWVWIWSLSNPHLECSNRERSEPSVYQKWLLSEARVFINQSINREIFQSCTPTSA